MKKEKRDKVPEQESESPFQRFEQFAKKVVSAPRKPKKTEEIQPES